MINLVGNKKHLVIKRDGKRTEPYDPNKMYKVLEWSIKQANPNLDKETVERIVNEILRDINIRIHDKIHISKLFDEVIKSVSNKITELQPIYDDIAKNLFLQKIYKETWRIKRDEYPDYLKVIEKAKKYKVYNENILNSFTEEELKELGEYIKPDRDFNFTFGGLNLFRDKYCLRHTKTKYLELPQHTFMRVAIQLFYKEKDKIEKIKTEYDSLSLFKKVVATPFYLNALREVFNPTSCVLIQVDDDSESIMETMRCSGIYGRNGSGIAKDKSRLRSTGSSIGIDGKSSGPVPFIQMSESVVTAFNQKSARQGSEADYFPWWHYDSPEMLLLKDAGGTPDERARKLKYGFKWNKILSEAVRKDLEITLFDPKETPKLIETYGSEFDKWYNFYCQIKNIKKRKIKARELVFSYLKGYSETGNIYWFNSDNVNKFRTSKDLIYQSNLCAEVLSANKPLKLKETKLIKDFKTNEIVETREYDGEIGICNLSNINLITWQEMSDKEKDVFVYNLLVSMDNSIELSDYPVKAGEKFNKLHRSIGIGVTNYHNWLVSNKIKMSSKQSLEETHYMMEDVNYYLVKNSIRLAKERGKYHYYEGSLWSKGIFHWELYEKHFKEVKPELNFEMKHDWEPLRQEMLLYGVRFENLMSIPPGATSSLALNFTEGTEPIREIKIKKEGTYNLTFLVPNLKNRMYYERCWNIDMYHLLDLTAIRQKFVDMSQSTNLYIQNPNSAYDILSIILYAEKLGIKTLYYLNSLKKNLEDEEICESCAV